MRNPNKETLYWRDGCVHCENALRMVSACPEASRNIIKVNSRSAPNEIEAVPTLVLSSGGDERILVGGEVFAYLQDTYGCATPSSATGYVLGKALCAAVVVVALYKLAMK